MIVEEKGNTGFEIYISTPFLVGKASMIAAEVGDAYVQTALGELKRKTQEFGSAYVVEIHETKVPKQQRL